MMIVFGWTALVCTTFVRAYFTLQQHHRGVYHTKKLCACVRVCVCAKGGGNIDIQLKCTQQQQRQKDPLSRQVILSGNPHLLRLKLSQRGGYAWATRGTLPRGQIALLPTAPQLKLLVQSVVVVVASRILGGGNKIISPQQSCCCCCCLYIFARHPANAVSAEVRPVMMPRTSSPGCSGTS
jgi:hypothetical protein